MKKGFTLIEMLVVIGIIAVLAGSLVMGFGHVTKTAQRAKAQETVSNAATSLSILLQANGAWPSDVLKYQGADGNGKGMVADVAKVLAKHKLMGVACKNRNGNPPDYTPVGVDRCGIVDPWAVAVLKRSQNATVTTKVPSGGTVQDHIIYYAVDKDGDGFTEATVNGTSIKVRATAIAWCAGGDGVLGDYTKAGRTDDVFSWRKGQEVK